MWKMIFPIISSVTTVFVFLTARLFVSQRLAVLSAVAYGLSAFVYSLEFAACAPVAFIAVGCFTLIALNPRARNLGSRVRLFDRRGAVSLLNGLLFSCHLDRRFLLATGRTSRATF